MKRMFALILCMCLLLCSSAVAESAEIYKEIDGMSKSELSDLYEYIGALLEQGEQTGTTLTATEIVETLIETGFSIYDVETYDEATDPNKLLGRPNQYTSKCNAFDKRIKKYSNKDAAHVIVEVFSNEKDCKDRYDYVNSLSAALVGQYVYKIDNVLFRVSNDLLPSEAKQYEDAVRAITSGETYALVAEEKTEEQTSAVAENKTIETTITEATRKSPAAIGQRVLLNDCAVTILHSFVGEKAKAIVRSFDSYNTRSYAIEKNEEWLLLFVKIEGLDTLESTQMLTQYAFSVMSKDGVRLDDGYSTLMGNPREISDVIPDSVQYCWFGVPIEKGADALIFFDDYFLGQAWFDISARIPADTSNETYSILQRNDTGLLVDRVQLALYDYGYRKNIPDGVYGNATSQSIKKFQTDCGLEPTGQTDDETLRWLLSGKPVPEK